MKIYAKQVPPEYQESPLFHDDWPENVHVFGNRDYNEHGNYYKTVEYINNLSQDIDELRSGCGWYTGENLESLLQDYFPREKPYTRAERLRVLDLVMEFFNAREYSAEERAAVLAFMELRDGIKYASAEIRGCCQGDWQNIVYPAEYGRAWLECFESEYFNTGSEWIIDDTGDAMTDPADIVGWSLYAHAWGADAIRAEIAAAVGVNTDDVILYQFNGWTKTAKYQEVI